jgi:iron complex outermembrane receptor protein
MNTATQAGHALPEALTTDALPTGRRLDASCDESCDAIVAADEPRDSTAICLPAGLHRALAKMAMVLALFASCPPPALALMAQEPIAFNIPSGPLGIALIEIGKRCGAIVSFNPSLVEGTAAAPVQGQFTPMQAFMQALSASGLSLDVTPNGTVTVHPHHAAKPVTKAHPEQPGHTAHESTLPIEETHQATLADTPVYALDAVLVLASAEAPQADGLRASTSSTATRTDTPVSELPQSVSVITRDALDMQGLNATTTDALRHVAGVTDVGEGIEPLLMVRGLPAQYLLSGMRTSRAGLSIDNAFIERLEVLKGPSGAIGGAAEFGGRGGVVNLVRRSIETEPFAEVKQGFSSRNGGTLRTDLDAAGELAPRTYWRAMAYSSHTGRTDGGYDAQYADGLLGVFGYRGADFKATLTLQADNQRLAPVPTSQGGMERPDGTFSPVQPSQFDAIDATDGRRWHSTDIELDLSWQLSAQWRMTWKGRHERLDSDFRRHLYWTYGDEEAGVDRVSDHTVARGLGMQWGLLGDVATGPMKHQLLIAFDRDRGRAQSDVGSASWDIDPAAFEPGSTPLPGAPYYEGSDTAAVRVHKRSLLLQDQIHLGNWIARLAAQRSQSSETNSYYGMETQEPKVTNWDAGLLYQVTPTVSVYAGTQYSAEVDLRGADFLLYDGTEVPLRKLRQTQAGTKMELMDRKLALTVEAFRLRQLTTLQSSTELPDSGIFTLPGRSSTGVEAELAGRVSPALDMHLGLSLMRTRDVIPGPDSAPQRGVELPAAGVPKRSMYLLARYRLPGTQPARDSVGFAFRAYSSSWVVPPYPAVDAGQLSLPGGAQLDLSWMRATDRWSLRLSVENLFDRQLYSPQSTPGYIPLEPRRSFSITTAFAF